MKTVKELSEALHINGSTLLKAAQRSLKYDGEQAWVRQSGSTYLIDEDAPQFKSWLAGTGKGRPRQQAQ